MCTDETEFQKNNKHCYINLEINLPEMSITKCKCCCLDDNFFILKTNCKEHFRIVDSINSDNYARLSQKNLTKFIEIEEDSSIISKVNINNITYHFFIENFFIDEKNLVFLINVQHWDSSSPLKQGHYKNCKFEICDIYCNNNQIKEGVGGNGSKKKNCNLKIENPVSIKEFISLMENFQFGYIFRYNDEKKNYQDVNVILPPDCFSIISDFKSFYGVKGWRRNAYKNTCFKGLHAGIDFYLPPNYPLVAVADGKIYGVKNNDFCVGSQLGLYVGKQKSKEINLIYLHIGKILVKEGQNVKRGDVIALSGNADKETPCIGGIPHLHLQCSLSQGYGTECESWGTYRYGGDPCFTDENGVIQENWLNPHLFWSKEGCPEFYNSDVKNYNGLTLPFLKPHTKKF